MQQFTSSFLDELEKVAKKSSKKKRAAGISAGATSGAMMGAPAGLLTALALIARKPRRYKIAPPKGLRAQLKYFRGSGFAKDLKRVQRDAEKKALKGVAIGGGVGAGVGGLAGHEISKHGAVISSRITPQSSSVRGFSYDKKSGNMLVTFKSGGTYRYKGVTPAVAKAMGRNKSVGKTVHKRLKKGGYEYEKVGAKKKQKNYKCKFCKEQATKGVIWAEGRGIVPCCDKHLAKGKVSIDDPKDIDLIRDLTKTARLRSYNYSRIARPALWASARTVAKGAVDPKLLRGMTEAELKMFRAQMPKMSMVRERIREGGKVATMIKEAPKKTVVNAQTRFVRSRQGNPNSSTAKYYAKKRREMRKASSAQILSNLEARAEKVATPAEGMGIMDGMTARRKEIAKMAGRQR